VAAAALTADDPAQAVYTGLSAFLDACLKPEFRQIVVLDSVPVLQRQAWEDGSTGHSELDMPSQVLTPLAAPYLPGLDMESLAHVALGGLYGAALNIARSPEPNRPGRGGRRPGHPHHRTPIVAGAGRARCPWPRMASMPATWPASSPVASSTMASGALTCRRSLVLLVAAGVLRERSCGAAAMSARWACAQD
jgi:hypothetical protein